MATRIVNCTCAHPYQDKAYGTGRRVANSIVLKSANEPQYRCTVCQAIRKDRGNG